MDNLYLDMNGITSPRGIHPCCHPEDGPQPNDENEIRFWDILEIIYQFSKYSKSDDPKHFLVHRPHHPKVIFSMVRPRKLIFMAIDGVAPRAKMNLRLCYFDFLKIRFVIDIVYTI